MNKSLEIFISHHHSDAKKLGSLKKQLAAYDIEAFIAHEDIEPGEHDLNTIKKELEARNIFLLIGSSDAQDSPFVNQEIGFALGQDKDIISTIKAGSSTWGFITHQQAITYKDIADAAFFNKLLKEIARFAKDDDYLEKKENALSTLGAKDILINTNRSNTWNLELDGWNDYRFRTRFTLKKGSRAIADIRIAHADFPDSNDPKKRKNLPKDNNEIKDFLPDDNFSFLDKKFFSRIIQFYEETISPEQQEAIRCLFNDIETDKEIAKQYAYKTVTEVSLFRLLSGEDSEYRKFLKGINNDQ